MDAWFGTRDLPRLLKTLRADYKKQLVGERLSTPPIMPISKLPKAAIARVRLRHPVDARQARLDTMELVMPPSHWRPTAHAVDSRAQDLTYYGLDLYKERKLAELVDRLSVGALIGFAALCGPTGFPMDALGDGRKLPATTSTCRCSTLLMTCCAPCAGASRKRNGPALGDIGTVPEIACERR